MKKLTLALFMLIVFCNISFAKPILTKSKYLIATLLDGATGTVSPGTNTYPLAYYADRDAESATESDYWIIKEQGSNEYTFQNASTLQYIRHDNTSTSDRTALVLTDAIQADKSTSFTLDLKESSNLCYYVIRSVVNPEKVWNRRETAYETIFPVGVFAGSGTANECFILYDSEGNPAIDDTKTGPVLPSTDVKTLGSFTNYAHWLTFDGKTPVVDTSAKEFYLSVPEGKIGTDVILTVNYSLMDAACKLYIDNTEIVSGTTCNFSNVTAAKSYPVEIRNGTTVVASGTILFSCLPLIQIYSSSAIGTVYNLTRIAVTEPDKTDTTEVILSDIKTRGAYSSTFPKKSYALKLKDVDGVTSIDRSFLGFRSDNNWILDAMFVDPGRMRNRVSTDLWNDFSTRPYHASSEPTMINGTRGSFVEVFLNDSYNGLYCMTEKVDRKQLKLKKLKYSTDLTTVTQRGGLYKADQWSTGTLLGYNFLNSGLPMYDNNSAVWSGYEAKYPDMDDGEPIQWKPLYDAIYTSSYLTNDATFRANVATCYDLPVFLDYYLFIELMLASDNHGKNTYLYVYDQTVSSKLSLAPWDLDGTWGRRWDGTTNLTVPNQDFDSFITTYEHAQNNLFLRLRRLNLDGYTTKLKDRYKELRGSYFSYSSLMERFRKYNDLFDKSGAASRERKRWNMEDNSTEINFLSTWITDRLSYLDNQYLGGQYVGNAVIDVSASKIKFAPNPVRDVLTVFNLTAGEKVQVISLQGDILIQTQSNGGNEVVNMSGLASGVYLIKAGQEVSKLIKK